MTRTLFAALLLLTLAGIAHAELGTGARAPEFRVTAGDGSQLSLAGLAGTVIVLDFAASWCPPCRSVTSYLAGLQGRHQGKPLQIITLNVDLESKELLAKSMKERGAAYPMATAPEQLQHDYGVTALPHLVVIDRQGLISGEFEGFNADTAARLDRLVETLLTPR